MRATETVRRKVLIGYGLGSVGMGLYSSITSVLLLFFMTDTLGISPAWAAWGIFVPKMIGAVADPVAGLLSDRTRSRWGRRRPWMVAGAIVLSISFAMLFRVPAFNLVESRLVFVMLVFTATAIGYSMFSVPYLAMPAEMSDSSIQRTRVVMYRMIFVMLGIILGSAAAPMIVQAGGGGAEGYAGMSLVIGGLAAVSLFSCIWLTVSARTRPSSAPLGDSSLAQVFMPLRDRAFVALIGVFVLQTLASSLFSAALPYIVISGLGADQQMVGLLLLTLLLVSALCMPLWRLLAQRMGKCGAFMVASLGNIVAVIALALPLHELVAPILLFLNFALLGIFFAGLQLLPFAMATDVMTFHALHRGRAAEGAFAGIWTAFEKLSLALGPLVVAVVLILSDYEESAGQVVVQAPETIASLYRWIIILPVIIQLASLVLLRRYQRLEPRENAVEFA